MTVVRCVRKFSPSEKMSSKSAWLPERRRELRLSRSIFFTFGLSR